MLRSKEIGRMRSSYKENNYGDLLYSIVKVHKPTICIECGILDGYSTIYIAKALKDLSKQNHQGKLWSFDLFDEYEYKHGKKYDVRHILRQLKLRKFVEVNDGNFFELHNQLANNSIDFMHIDISNSGETVVSFLLHWVNKIKINGIVIFEGGSKERDQVEWMTKYHFPEIQATLNDSRFETFTFQPFPSITIMRRIK